MQKTLIFFLIGIFSYTIAHAQLSSSNKILLRKILTKKINTLRKQKNKVPLKQDISLEKAAKLHTRYMAKHQKLVHEEANEQYKNPSNRVASFNKSFVNIKENILYTKPVRLPLNRKTLYNLAATLFLQWKNTPTHYTTMISEKYTHSGYGFKYNRKTKRIYATQILGKKTDITVKEQFYNKAFGIKKRDKTCSSFINYNDNLITNMGNSLRIINGEIIFKYHDKAGLKRIIKSANDGIAIDLVSKEQLSCEHKNKLDKSPIYDGTMLKPIYRNAFFAKNKAQSDFRYIANLGKIPKSLLNKKLSPNLILIKNGKKCAYKVPAEIPSKSYRLLPVKPIIYTPKIALKTSGVNTIKRLFFNFKSGNPTAINSPKITSSTKNVYRIDIKSFTSVDGITANNNKLHNKRATYIKNYISKKIDLAKIKVYTEAKENWELCNYQLLLLGKDSLVKLDVETKKNYIQKNLINQWKEELSLQRKSTATLFEYGTWKKNEHHAYNNLVHALITNNNDLANKALATMYKQKNNNSILGQDFILERLIKRKELVQNTAALIIKNIHYYNIDKIVFYVSKWLSKPKELSKDAQKNLLNLYAITTRELLQNWDTDSKKLSKVVHPDKVLDLLDQFKGSEKMTALFLNFHMASIEYYGQTNYSPMIDVSFDYIINYFKKKAMTIEDDIALCLFFNSWSRFDLTVKLLHHSYLYKELNEEALFIFLKTAVAYRRLDRETLKYLHKQAIDFNKEKWCSWINKNFQNLRSNDVKKLYCNTCNMAN